MTRQVDFAHTHPTMLSIPLVVTYYCNCPYMVEAKARSMDHILLSLQILYHYIPLTKGVQQQSSVEHGG